MLVHRDLRCGVMMVRGSWYPIVFDTSAAERYGLVAARCLVCPANSRTSIVPQASTKFHPALCKPEPKGLPHWANPLFSRVQHAPLEGTGCAGHFVGLSPKIVSAS